jgi:hypothetical protein
MGLVLGPNGQLIMQPDNIATTQTNPMLNQQQVVNGLMAPGAGVRMPQQPGVLGVQTGYMDLMNSMPTMPKDEFDPAKALMGGALMDVSRIILGEKPQNGPMAAYQMARQMYDRDRMQKYQTDQNAFQNKLALGQLVATLQKAGAPVSTAGKVAQDLFGKDLTQLNATELGQVRDWISAGSPSTKVEVDAAGSKKYSTVEAERASNFTGAMEDVIFDNTTQGDIVQQLQILNQGIGTSGTVGNLADSFNNSMTSLGIDFQVTADTPFREAYKGLANKLAMKELQFFKGPTTDFEFGVAASINGNLDQSQEGRALLLDLAKGRSSMQTAAAQAYLDWEASLPEGKTPKRVDFLKSDQFKQLQTQSVYTTNPGLLGKIAQALPTPAARTKLLEDRNQELNRRYKSIYPDLNDTQIQDMVDQQLDIELGN